ncbi:MAG: HGGxSTG domain-containing protein [Planctomycetota bacterium]
MQQEKKCILLRNGNPQGNPNNAPRCGAKTRKGTTCRAPAMANGRCRMHGGKSTGPRTPEGLERSKKANWKHGYYSAGAGEMRLYIKQLLRENQALTEFIKEKFLSQ